LKDKLENGGITFAVVLVATVSSVPREGHDVVVSYVVPVEAAASAHAQWLLSPADHQSDLHIKLNNVNSSNRFPLYSIQKIL